jgi:hypothetical protein
VSLSQRTAGGGRGKENVSEGKILKQYFVYEYNIIHCIVSG